MSNTRLLQPSQQSHRLPPSLIAVFIGLLLVVPLLAMSVIRIEGPRIRADALADLNAIGRLKADQIGAWLAERRNDAEILMASGEFNADVERWLLHRDSVAESRLAGHRAILQRTYGYQLELVGARALADSPPLAAALASGVPQIGELYRDEAGRVWLDVLVPLFGSGPLARPIGVALLRSMASDFLFPFIRTWPTHSPSAETLLVRREGDGVLFLNELRHRKDSALSLRLPLDSPELPAAMAVRKGIATSMEGRDYRGVRVLAASHPIPGTNWFLVTKLDQGEVFNPLYKLVTWVGAVALFAVVLVVGFLHRLWRQHLHGQELQRLASQDEALRASEAHFRLLASATFEGIALTCKGRFVDANPQLLDMLGYTREELIGKAVADLLTEEDQERVLDNILKNRESRIEHAMLCKDGHFIQIEAHGKPLDDHEPDLRITALRDISDRQAAEAALRFQLDLNRGITEKSTDSIFINDAEGRVTALNPEAERMFGFPAAELLGHRLHDVIHHHHVDGQHYPMGDCPLCNVYVTGEVIRDHETTVFHRDGTPLMVTISNAALESGGRIVGAALVVHDITTNRQAEQALQEREDDLNRAQAVGHIGSWRLDVRSNTLTWSRENHRIFGIPEGTPLTYETFLNCVHPEDRERVDQAWQAGLEGMSYDIEHRLLIGGKVFWVREKAELEFDAEGRLLGGFGTTQDITGLKQAELALRDADQRKDEFLAMLAHELRNPLAPIRNAAHVLGRLDVDEPRVYWAREVIERQVGHLTHLVDELLDVSRIARGKVRLRKATFELAELLNQARESVQPMMSARRHRLVVTAPEPGLQIEGDLVRLTQVLQNLLYNAAKYTPDGGLIELSTCRDGAGIQIRVQDNGMGIPPDLLPDVFDLFRQGERTLDRSQGGLGIGLTLVQRLVNLHGGRVEAQSPGPGLGACFTVWLPVGSPVAISAPKGQPGPASSAPGEPLRVLVVDDDPAVAESMAVFLEMEGHQVRSARSGAEALEQIGAFRPRVVLLDIGLPGQSGYEVAKLLRQTEGGRDTILVAVTGYGHDDALALSREAGFDHHLVKPVDPDRLVALLGGFAGAVP